MVMKPRNWARNEMNTIAIRMGAMYLIMIRHAARQRNFDEAMISSSMIFGLIHQPTKIQVRNATIGIMMVFEMKSKKSVETPVWNFRLIVLHELHSKAYLPNCPSALLSHQTFDKQLPQVLASVKAFQICLAFEAWYLYLLMESLA